MPARGEIVRGSSMQTLMSSESEEYLTPAWLLDLVERVAPIGLDPCGHLKSEATRRAKIACILPTNLPGAGGADGLRTAWSLNNEAGSLVFVNPPYGRQLKPWAEKMATERDCPIITLVPARVDTAWWRTLNPVVWCALAGRVSFLSCQHKWEPATAFAVLLGRAQLACKLCQATSTTDAKGKFTNRTSCPIATPSETDPAPFPSAVCLLHTSSLLRRFVEVFSEHGHVYQRIVAEN